MLQGNILTHLLTKILCLLENLLLNVCDVCFSFQVLCGRYVNEHMSRHGHEIGHPLTLSFSDLSVWCYQCEAYIDNPVC